MQFLFQQPFIVLDFTAWSTCECAARPQFLKTSNFTKIMKRLLLINMLVVIVLHNIIIILSRIKVKVPRTGWPPRFTISNFYPTHYTHFTHYTCYIHPLYPLYSHYTHCTLTHNTHCTHNCTSHTIRATPTTIPPRYISDLAPLPSFSLLSSNPPISGTSVYITLRKKQDKSTNHKASAKCPKNLTTPSKSTSGLL